MLLSRVKPNYVTFTCVLSGCSHSGLKEEGVQIFNSMSRDHLVEPDVKHYSCVIATLVTSTNHEFIQRMPMEPNACSWGTLLSGCRVYKNVKFAKISAKKLFEILPKVPGYYVTLFNILVTAKLWGETSKIRMLMKERGITNTPGCIWLQVGNRVHNFVVGDKSNRVLKSITFWMSWLRKYKPGTDHVLHDIFTME
ncbi:unnamed protein product [Trifolium pratense]|uniref:Uncharacterized protein n=1 Tax=Trifolium pratense TaxID=57577 RepID=A0ACB0KTQ2_TRIPR|nr:unnamed protein product [Trifolium pratense]